jgi:hypothetical protein
MGRKVRRVPLDFEWPLDKVWEGFLSPHYAQCPDCTNGSTIAHDYFSTCIRLLLMADSDSRRGRVHPYFGAMGLFPDQPAEPEKMAELARPLLGDRYDVCVLGIHDAINQWCAEKKILESLGLPGDWGHCPTCDGSNIHPDHREAYEAWEKTPPPEGDGWQMWETCSEGSPISPVFETPEELARWLADTNASAFGSEGASYDNWLGMIREGWAASACADSQGLRSGVEMIGGLEREKRDDADDVQD